MESLDRLKDQLTALDGAIEAWEPDPGRPDWLGQRARARELKTQYDALCAGIEEACAEIDEPALGDVLNARAADLAGEIAVYLQLSGDPKGASDLLSQAIALTSDGDQQAMLAAGKHDPDGWATFVHGRWLANAQRMDDAERVLTPLLAAGKAPSLTQAAREVLNRPRPIGSAPSLFRFNGCGQALYGHRDDWDDGSYVATLCICLLFIPVFPVRAYRVIDRGDGWGFYGIVPLSPFAKMSRWLMAAVVALGVGGAALSSYVGSDSYQAGAAMEEAQALEASDKAAAIQRYREVIDSYGYVTDVSEAVDSIIRLVSENVPSPCSHEHVEIVGRVVNAFYELPEHARAGAEQGLVDRLVAWSDEIGDASLEKARAKVAVLDMAAELSSDRAGEPRARAVEKLADQLAGERPLMALTLYASLPGAAAKGEKIVAGFGAAPSLWRAGEADVRALIAAGATALQQKLDDALAQGERDDALIEEGDDGKLDAALKAQPDNQEIAAAVAGKQRDRGQTDAAIATLEAVGPAGRMTGMTHQLLGVLYRDAGRLEDADALLSPFVDERITQFQKVQRSYVAALEAAESRVMAQLRSGNVPRALEVQLENAVGDDAQGAILRAYLREQIAQDPELSRLQETFIQQQAVVPVSMTLGMVKLARANAASGPARNQLLTEAEKAFLAIRGAAEGQPSYHLGLGEVYHRLGKAEDGDRELGSLLEQGDPQLTIEVATAYRNLGKTARAREILQGLYDSPAPEEMRQSAAYVLSLLATSIDEQATWLGRADATRSDVKIGLIELRGTRAAEAGDHAAADKAYAEVAQLWRAESEHNPVAINNEAVAHMSRYGVSGDVAHLKQAAQRFEAALKLNGDAPLTMQNLADALQHVGLVTLLGAHFQIELLVPDSSDASDLAGVLVDNDPRFRAELASQPQLKRSVELSKQLQVLAPHRYSGYRFEKQMLMWQDDAAGLEKLHGRLSQGQAVDVTDVAQQRRKYEAGELDDMLRRRMNTAGTTAAERLERAKASGHAPTIAAAELLYGGHLFAMHTLFGEGELEVALSHYRSAAEAWDTPGIRHRLAWALLHVGVMSARADAPALDKIIASDVRAINTITLAAQAALSGDAGIRDALGKQPLVREAVDAGRAAIEAGESFELWLAAGWVGDDALKGAGAKLFDERIDEWSRKIEVLLYPGERREQTELAVYEAAAKAR